jgi:hypothetical protein
MKLSFGFAKKAEPKKHVAAFSTKKEEPKREIIKAVEEGQLDVEAPIDGGPLVIKCKNPLDSHNESRKPKPKVLLPVGAKVEYFSVSQKCWKPAVVKGTQEGLYMLDVKPTPVEPSQVRAQAEEKSSDDLPGGLVSKNMSKLSAEDAEAMRELLRDASREGEGDAAPAAAVAPILMKDGVKRAREGAAPEATREMFENVPVESFGEAMLRGMGYDPKVHLTKPIVRDKLRDNLLGLGAKALLPGEKATIANKKKGASANAPGAAGAPGSAVSANPKTGGTATAIASAAGPNSASSSESAQKRHRS